MSGPGDAEPPRDREPGEGGTEEVPALDPEFQRALREAAGEGPADEQPAEQQPGEEQPVEVQPAEEQPAPEQPPAEGQPDPEQPPTVEQPAPEQPSADEGTYDGEPGSELEPAAEERTAAYQEPDSEVQPAAEEQPAGGETVEYAPGEGPEAEAGEQEVEAEVPADGDGAKPVRTVAIASEAGAETATPPPTTPALPQRPSAQGDPEPAPRRPRLWLRFGGAAVLVIVSFAAATSISILRYIDSVAAALQDNRLSKVGKYLAKVEPGEPQNILILGSDKLASLPGTKGLSDTTILLRLDPDNQAIAIMNIPRDLKTYIPGVGTDKFNAAYAYGGPKLTLRVVKRITGLQINHVVNVDFLGFVRAINAIDCVYVDVDRHYLHSNAGLPAELQYSEINIRPGYQRLCGDDALAYVRYRHTDTDLVRAARQQDFLREARQRVPVGKLVSDRKQLTDIFTDYTSSDIDSLAAALAVLEQFLAARNAPIKEVRFPAILHPSFVTADKADVAKAVAKFEGIEASGGPRGALEPSVTSQTGIVPEERKRAHAKKKGSPPPSEGKLPTTPSTRNDGLVDSSQGSRDIASTAAKRVGRGFPVFYPRRLPSGAIYVDNPRVYHVKDADKKPHGAYRMVLQLPQGDYFGIQGIRGWSNPPILAEPSETRTIGGREYGIFIDGDRVRVISWEQNGNSYWVSNSLLQTLTNDQMLGIARSIGKLPGERGGKKRR